MSIPDRAMLAYARGKIAALIDQSEHDLGYYRAYNHRIDAAAEKIRLKALKDAQASLYPPVDKTSS